MGIGLTLADVTVARGGRTLFAPVSVTLAAGEAVWLRAPNGAGKTTLLRAIAGVHPVAGGTVSCAGFAADLTLDDVRSDAMHLLGHRDPLASARTARQELIFWATWTGGAVHDDVISRLGLAAFLDLPCRVLSAGQRRRLALARLLSSPRPIWLLDEPLAPLDEDARAVFASLLSTHLAGGGLALVAAHDPVPRATRELSLTGAACA